MVRDGDKVEISWQKAADNVLTAYYQVFVDGRPAGETHGLSCHLPSDEAAGAEVEVCACDLDGNVSKPSTPALPAGR